MKNIIIMGVGNILMEDEGIGIRVVERLTCSYHIPDNIEVVDGGTAGTELLGTMRNAEHLIIADCVNTGANPGSLVTIKDDDIPAFFQTKLSNHQLGISDLLAILKMTDDEPEQVTIVGMVPFSIENKLKLSENAEKLLDEMLALLVSRIEVLGIKLKSKTKLTKGFWEARSTSDLPCV